MLQGKEELALPLFRRVLEIEGRRAARTKAANLRQYLGPVRDQGDGDEAIRTLEDLFRRDPDHALS